MNIIFQNEKKCIVSIIFFIRLCVVFLFILQKGIFAGGYILLDDFTDGDWNANGTWGTWSDSAGGGNSDGTGTRSMTNATSFSNNAAKYNFVTDSGSWSYTQIVLDFSQRDLRSYGALEIVFWYKYTGSANIGLYVYNTNTQHTAWSSSYYASLNPSSQWTQVHLNLYRDFVWPSGAPNQYPLINGLRDCIAFQWKSGDTGALTGNLIIDNIRLYTNHNTGPFYVSINGDDGYPGTFNLPFYTLQHAVDVMMPGLPNCSVSTTYVFPGIYTQSVVIRSNKNSSFLTITALSNSSPMLHSGTSTSNFGIKIINSTNIAIIGFDINKYLQYAMYIDKSSSVIITSNKINTNSQYGIYLTQSPNAQIVNNSIFSNTDVSIYLNYACDNAIVSNNHISQQKQNDGIKIESSKLCVVKDNFIHHINAGAGITLILSASSNYGHYIVSNDIMSNKHGMWIDSSDNNTITSNRIIHNIERNIYLGNSIGQFVSHNIIWDSQYLVYFDSTTSSTLYRNALGKGSFLGVYFSTGTSGIAIVNNTLISNNGSIFNRGSVDVFKNNIVVFGAFSGIQSSLGVFNNITYNNVYSNNPNYVNVTPGVGTITNAPLFISTDIHSTNFLKLSTNSPCIDSGDPADTVPIGGGGRIDMGWKEYVELVTPFLIKSVSNIISPLGNSRPIPGAKIVYKLYFTNFGLGQNECIYDHISKNTIFNTNVYMSGLTGWTLEYSTNLNPLNQYSSSDYSSTIPADKKRIKWIRWKKSNLQNNEAGYFVYEVLIR